MSKIMRFDFIMEEQAKKYRITLGMQRIQVYCTSLVDRQVHRSSFANAMNDILEHKDGTEVWLNRTKIENYSVENIIGGINRELEDKREEQRFASMQKDSIKRKRLRKENKGKQKPRGVILADDEINEGDELVLMDEWVGKLMERRPDLVRMAPKADQLASNGKPWPSDGVKHWPKHVPISRERFPGWSNEEILAEGFIIKEENNANDN